MSRIFRRDIFTGEFEEVESDVEEAFEAVNARSREKFKNLVSGHRHTDPYVGGKDFICKGISIAPEQATPERIARENAGAKRHATGAYYTPDGACHLPTRGIRAREMKRKHRQDNDGGYSDCVGD